MKMNGARIFVECLKREQVDTIFYYSGGSVILMFDELYKNGGGIRCIQPRHEQAGTHAADAYARCTGKPGVVVVTSGPGATNTVTGIATAYMDSVPMVVFTGQVSTGKIGTDAFQEADITGITLPMTKAGYFVRSVDELADTIKTAFHIAVSGRPGPVVVDIPSNVQQAVTEFHYPDSVDLAGYKPTLLPHKKQIKTAAELIKNAKKPLIIAGGGVVFSGSTGLLNRFADRFNIPVVTTLMGRGVCPGREELCYGGIGMHGTRYGNYAVQEADLLIGVGIRFSDRILGNPDTFAPKAGIIHIDIDPAEIGKNVEVDVPIVGHIGHALEQLLVTNLETDTSAWVRELEDYKTNHPLEYDKTGGLKPQFLVETAAKVFREDTVVCTDVGQNQMWVAQYYPFRHPRTLMTSGGLGTMGYGLPAAIGAALACPGKQVLMVSGDGGFQMNLQELATVKRYNLPVKMLVLDNGYLGMVRQWQELMCEKRYSGTVMNDNPDFAQIANVYGIPGVSVDNMNDAEEAVKELAASDQSMLLHAKVEPGENVLPMVPAGKSLEQMLIKIGE